MHAASHALIVPHGAGSVRERPVLPRMQGCAAAELFEGLLMLQHRGQDSAGMVTYDGARFCEHKANGLVNDVFQPRDMATLRGAPNLPSLPSQPSPPRPCTTCSAPCNPSRQPWNAPTQAARWPLVGSGMRMHARPRACQLPSFWPL